MTLWRASLLALTLAAFIQSTNAQGQIIFANRDLPKADGSGTYNAPIDYDIDFDYSSGDPGGAGGPYHAALLLVKADGTLRLVGTTTFRTDPYPDNLYFASSPTLTVDGGGPPEDKVIAVRGVMKRERKLIGGAT